MNMICKKLRLFARYLPPILISATAICFVMLIGYAVFAFSPANSAGDSQKNTTLLQSPDSGKGYVESIVFLTDKAMSSASSVEIDYDLQIWTGANGSLSLDSNVSRYATIVFPHTENELTIAKAVALQKPEYIIISVGIDNGTACDKAAFMNYYGDLVGKIQMYSPNTQIILQSILPVSHKYEREHVTVTKEKINECNNWIAELAATKKLKYLDTASALKNGFGYLDRAYDSGNGVTLSSLGYEKAFMYIRTHVCK